MMLFAVRCWIGALPALVFVPGQSREDAEDFLEDTFEVWSAIVASGGLVPLIGSDRNTLWVIGSYVLPGPWPEDGEPPIWEEGVDLGED